MVYFFVIWQIVPPLTSPFLALCILLPYLSYFSAVSHLSWFVCSKHWFPFVVGKQTIKSTWNCSNLCQNKITDTLVLIRRFSLNNPKNKNAHRAIMWVLWWPGKSTCMIHARVRECQVLTCGEPGLWAEPVQMHTFTRQCGSRLCQSVFMAPLWSWYTGRAQSRQGCFNNAPIESEGELPALALWKHHVNYACKGQRRSSDNTEQKQSSSLVCITKILSCSNKPVQGGGLVVQLEKNKLVTLLLTSNLKHLACCIF